MEAAQCFYNCDAVCLVGVDNISPGIFFCVSIQKMYNF